MCLYITIILPREADVKIVRSCASAYGLGLDPFMNPFLQQQLRAGEQAFLTASGMCDCGTPIGSAVRDRSLSERERRSPQQLLLAKAEQHRKHGWSQAKVDRWLLQQQQRLDRNERVNRDRLRDDVAGYRQSLEDWSTLLNDVVGSNAASYVAMLLHMYHGKLVNEMVTVKSRVNISLRDVTLEALAHIQEDVIYELRA